MRELPKLCQPYDVKDGDIKPTKSGVALCFFIDRYFPHSVTQITFNCGHIGHLPVHTTHQPIDHSVSSDYHNSLLFRNRRIVRPIIRHYQSGLLSQHHNG